MTDIILIILLVVAFPMGTFIAGIFLGLRLAPQQEDDNPRVVVVQPTSDNNNSWPTSIDTGNHE